MLTLDERRALGLSDAAIGVPSANKSTSKEVKKSSRRRLRRRQRKPNQTKLAQQSVKSAMAPAKRNDWMDSIVEKVPVVEKPKPAEAETRGDSAERAIAKLKAALESADVEELASVIEAAAGLEGAGKLRKIAKRNLKQLMSRLTVAETPPALPAPALTSDAPPALTATCSSSSGKAESPLNDAESSDTDEGDDHDVDEDDWASSWQQCQENGESWGGRGRGGRGAARRYQSMSTASRNVLVESVSLAYRGRSLLEGATVRLVHRRRYGLVGANGVGKTTLLRSIARGTIPGFPLHLHCVYVEQEWSADRDMTPLAALLDMGHKQRRAELQEELSWLEERLEELDDADDEVVTVASRLGDVEDLLEELDSEHLQHHALQILMRLGFTASMAKDHSCRELSGGWRMRLVLARALIHKPDILLLDEPTNHLDLHGVLWLENFLRKESEDCPTVLLVSHDRKFLEAVATDIIVFEKQQLTYFPGTFSEYQINVQEKSLAAQNQFAARMRQEKKAKDMIQKLQNSKVKHHKEMKQMKQKMHKINRIGLRLQSGKRFKQNSIKKLDAKYMRVGTQALAPERKRAVEIKLPAPSALKGSAAGSIVSLDKVSCGYTRADGSVRVVLRDVSLQVGLKSRVAVVGANGAGKSTLLNVLMGKLKPLSGDMRRASTAKIAMVAQHHTQSLRVSLRKSAVDHLLGLFKAKYDVSALDMRAHLGKFGLTGDLALLPIGKLSGGQKVRVSLAALTYERPHVLVMDEPTNHLDMESLDAMAKALRAYEGGVVLVSHNRSFCASFCKDLWVVEAGKDGTPTRAPGIVKIMRGDDDNNPFAKLFQKYTSSVMKGSSTVTGRSKQWKNNNKSKVGSGKRQTQHMGKGATSRSGFI